MMPALARCYNNFLNRPRIEKLCALPPLYISTNSFVGSPATCEFGAGRSLYLIHAPDSVSVQHIAVGVKYGGVTDKTTDFEMPKL